MSKRDVEALVQQCRELGWGVEVTAKGFNRITPPEGDIIISPSTGDGRALGNFKAELRRAGFNPEAVQLAKAEKAEAAITQDRAKNDAALARAAARAAERAKEAALAPIPTAPQTAPALPKAPTLASPFAPPPPPVTPTPVPSAASGTLAGYPRVVAWVTQKEAARVLADAKEAQEHGGCRQRKLNVRNAAKIQQGMELGEWELNPADSLVYCKEHGSIVNGQHRMKGLRDADPEFISAFYPDGVPFYITTGFPCAMSHIFDTGKARSAADALAVEGLEGWGPLPSAALRLAMLYDLSFLPDGVKSWPQWRNVQLTNTELTVAAAGPYRELLNYGKIASRAYTKSKMTRSSTMVAAFLIDRDNPGGSNPENGHTTELFWKGICLDDDIKAGDPRMALVRFAMRTGMKRGSESGSLMLAHILKNYANYMIGTKKVDLSTVAVDAPMPPVWQPGMRWFHQQLRFPLIGA